MSRSPTRSNSRGDTKRCLACIEGQGNQEAHYGGCISDPYFPSSPVKSKKKKSKKQEVTCWGCREDQPNQLAHMEPGGCLYVPDFEVYEREELEELNKEELKDILRKYNKDLPASEKLNVSGKKEELIMRILRNVPKE